MAEREYMTYEEAAKYIGIKRSTLYTTVTERNIQTYKFKYDKKRYLAISDVKEIKRIRENPWLAGVDEKKSEEPCVA